MSRQGPDQDTDDRTRRRPHLVLDVTRLIFAAWGRTPTGIARVELAYAEHFIAQEGLDLSFTAMDAVGRLRVVESERARRFVVAISRYWRSNIGSNWAYIGVALRALHIHTVLLLSVVGSLASLVARHRHSIYIIPSQLHLERPRAIERLKRSGGLSLVYFVHDVLPAVFPEYFPPGAERRARRRLEAAKRLADAVIVNSEDTAVNLRRMFGKTEGGPFILPAPLGLSIPLPRQRPPQPAQPHFIMIGTIEPRKNHLLILNLWRELRTELGANAPRLVVVGARGWENENVIDMFERSPLLRGVVSEHRRLSDDELVSSLMSARALLMPAFAEGYGMPLAEALALGVPALCSDIAVFREVGQGVPEFMHPLDGPAWRSAILDYCDETSARRQAQMTRLKDWRPTSWEDHFSRVSKLLRELDRSGEPPTR
jgi:glycosyltransferase involved in cell wall biosynthesis